MKTVDFSEIIAACDLKVSRSRHLIECMKYVSIEGQGHSLTLTHCRVHTKCKPDFLRNYCADLNHFFLKAFRYKEMNI